MELTGPCAKAPRPLLWLLKPVHCRGGEGRAGGGHWGQDPQNLTLVGGSQWSMDLSQLLSGRDVQKGKNFKVSDMAQSPPSPIPWCKSRNRALAQVHSRIFSEPWLFSLQSEDNKIYPACLYKGVKIFFFPLGGKGLVGSRAQTLKLGFTGESPQEILEALQPRPQHQTIWAHWSGRRLELGGFSELLGKPLL